MLEIKDWSPYRWWRNRPSAIVENTLTEYVFSALASSPKACEQFFAFLRKRYNKISLPEATSISLTPWPSLELPRTEEGNKLGEVIGRLQRPPRKVMTIEPDVLIESKQWLLVVECEKSHFYPDCPQMVAQYASAKLVFRQDEKEVYQLAISEGAPVKFEEDIRKLFDDMREVSEVDYSELGLSASDLLSRFLWVRWSTVTKVLKEVLGSASDLEHSERYQIKETLALLEHEGFRPLPPILDTFKKVAAIKLALQRLHEVLTAHCKTGQILVGSTNRLLNWLSVPGNRELMKRLRRTKVIDAVRLSHALQSLRAKPDLVAWSRYVK
jgi:hypothetical protein